MIKVKRYYDLLPILKDNPWTFLYIFHLNSISDMAKHENKLRAYFTPYDTIAKYRLKILIMKRGEIPI